MGMLSDITVSRTCSDCAVTFSSLVASFHLRRVGEGWAIDAVNDRGSRHDDWAGFSNLALAEKYLIWIWASAARTVLRKPLLGPELYARGFDPEVHAVAISPGTVGISSPEGRAVLIEPDATIFSHLMARSVAEINEMVTADL
jgi:hypothetical protein